MKRSPTLVLAIAGFALAGALLVFIFKPAPPQRHSEVQTSFHPPRHEETVAPPEEWKEDIQTISSDFDLPFDTAFDMMLKGGEFLSLDDTEQLRKAFDNIKIENPHSLEESVVWSLLDMLYGETEALLKNDFSLYAAVLLNGNHHLTDREDLVKQCTQAGVNVDPSSITDDELFETYQEINDSKADWYGVNPSLSRVSIERKSAPPTFPPGYWVSQYYKNIRTYNPLIKPNTSEQVYLKEHREVYYADVSLVVQRGPDWGMRITPFFFRFWLNPETGQWQFSEATMVKQSNKERDGTLFIF